VYAETGLGYSHSENSTTTFIAVPPLGIEPIATSTTSTVSTRSGVGVIFYFK
jgi:hypothetical protein